MSRFRVCGSPAPHVPARLGSRYTIRLAAMVISAALAACGPDPGDTIVDRRAEFTVERWSEGFETPTGLAFLPDGSALVIEKGGFQRVGEGTVRHVDQEGRHRVILSLPVCAQFERGLIGVAVDPHFTSNRFLYLYRTMDPAGRCDVDERPFAQKSTTTVNRISRFAWVRDIIDPASEVVLVDGIGASNKAHQGGGLAFGPDGMLYAAVGSASQDDDPTIPSRDPSRLEGKILRVSTDPNRPVPADNPFVNRSEANPLVWALGFRNPFGLDIDPATGTLVVADVGGDGFEELNVVVAGSDYGWPLKEGYGDGPLPGNPGEVVDPVYAYDHEDGCLAVIAGGFLIDDSMGRNTRGRFVFTDFACGKVWLVNVRVPAKGLTLLADIPHGKSDLTIGPDGLVYVVGTEGVIWRVSPKVGPGRRPTA